MKCSLVDMPEILWNHCIILTYRVVQSKLDHRAELTGHLNRIHVFLTLPQTKHFLCLVYTVLSTFDRCFVLRWDNGNERCKALIKPRPKKMDISLFLTESTIAQIYNICKKLCENWWRCLRSNKGHPVLCLPWKNIYWNQVLAPFIESLASETSFQA